MLRGSYATGRQPPPLEDLISTERTTCVEFFDPERRGADECPEAVLLVRAGGSSDLEMVRASTLSAGAILMPLGAVGPRLSLDYSTVRRTGDPYLLDEARVLAEEDRWPERVTRAPLTDEDRARGFTAGRLTLLDARAANGGSLTVKTLDARAEWPIEILGGRLQAYAPGRSSWVISRRVSSSLPSSGSAIAPAT
jgi:hypothetical protein